MRGLERIVQIRRSGLKPELVSLGMPERLQSTGIALEGQVVVDEGDSPTTQDLRALHGLTVIAAGKSGDFDRIEAWAKAAIKVGAKDVAVAVFSNEGAIDGPVWIHVNGETFK